MGIKTSQLLVGSHLYGTNTEYSDRDMIHIYFESDWNSLTVTSVKTALDGSFMRFLPNRHVFQYDCEESNTDFLWMTNRQFFTNLIMGDSTVNLDAFLFSAGFKDPIKYVRTYKILKCLLGYIKRDVAAIKDHDSTLKHRFHAARGIYMVEQILDSKMPSLEVIKNLGTNYEKQALGSKGLELRKTVTELFNKNQLDAYYVPTTNCELVQLQLNANNTKEFKY